MQPGELLTRITVPGRRPGEADAFAALSVGREGMSIVAAAASVRVVGGRIDEARVALGCVGSGAVRAEAVEERLAGAEASAGRRVGRGRGPRRDARAAVGRQRVRGLPAAHGRGLRPACAARRDRKGGGVVVSARAATRHTVGVEVNGVRYERDVEARRLLVHFLRDELELTGTHVVATRATAARARSSWTAAR